MACKIAAMMASDAITPAIIRHNRVFYWAVYTETNTHIECTIMKQTCLQCLMLLVGWQEGHPDCKKQWWGAGMVICLGQGADVHMAQLMSLPLTVSCFSKIQIGSDTNSTG